MKPNVRVLAVTPHCPCGVAVLQSASCKVPVHVFMLLSCDCAAVVGDFCCSCAHMGLIRRAAPVESIMSFSFIVPYLLLSFGARSWPLVCTSLFFFHLLASRRRLITARRAFSSGRIYSL